LDQGEGVERGMTTTFKAQSSPTADGVAYKRTFTDIAYAREIFDILQEISPMNEKQSEHARTTALVPFFEARYLLTDRELKRSGIKRVLELASGFSPRGLALTNEDPELLYLEVDLPEKMAMKRMVVEELGRRHGIRWDKERLILETCNIACADELRILTMHPHLTGAPVAVICEGLLRYISFEDKTTMGREIHALLKREGGVWITPDIEFKDVIATTPGLNERYEWMAREMGMDVRPNIFDHEQHAVQFFRQLGFNVTKCLLSEVREQLVSPQRLGLSREDVERDLGRRCAFVLTVGE
jgi:O-methyltransferase involved in polyketide biosynthesis